MELEELSHVVHREKQGEIPYSELLSPRYANAIGVGSLVHLFSIYDGYLLLIYFSTIIFSSLSGKEDEYHAIRCNIILGIIDVLAVLLYSLFSDSIFIT
jgi:hypothetical protein